MLIAQHRPISTAVLLEKQLLLQRERSRSDLLAAKVHVTVEESGARHPRGLGILSLKCSTQSDVDAQESADPN